MSLQDCHEVNQSRPLSAGEQKAALEGVALLLEIKGYRQARRL